MVTNEQHQFFGGYYLPSEAPPVPHVTAKGQGAPAKGKDPETTCYVCGGQPHEEQRFHKFWSVADAEKDFAREPAGTSNAEARYVADYRPY